MKKILIVLFFLSFLFISCSKEKIQKTDITGKWHRVDVKSSKVVTDDPIATFFIERDIALSAEERSDAYLFTKEGRVFFIDSLFSEEAFYTIQDSTLVFSYSNGEKVTVPMVLDGDEIFLYTDETDYYQGLMDYLYSSGDIVVSKVITSYIYKKE